MPSSTFYSDAATALKEHGANRLNTWNSSGSKAALSADQNDGANRIFDGFATVNSQIETPPFKLSDPVFAMGSCFAREIEMRLRSQGCAVLSFPSKQIRCINPTRFTPRAMWQEFKRIFGELPNWTEDALLFGPHDKTIDLHYRPFSSDLPESAPRADLLRERAMMKEAALRVADARIVILTLGYVESWLHKPTGLYPNHIRPQVVLRQKDDFEFHLLDYEDTVECLHDIHSAIARHHKTGDFSMVMTVSPVPLNKTFTRDDIVTANWRSKSILRAALDQFVRTHPRTFYFPSFEIVQFSNQSSAWRPDRIHVAASMADHIVKAFFETYFQPMADAVAAPMTPVVAD